MDKYRVALINMPFASVSMPSIALTQLEAVLEAELAERVEVEIFYLNLELAKAMTLPFYQAVSDQVEAVTAGLGDWFFRQVAFPELPDNTDAYMNRHFSEHRRALAQIQEPLLVARQRAEPFLEQLIARFALTEYSLVGMTSMFSQNVACFALAKKLKELRPEIVTVMGGANCETPMGQVIAKNVDAIDFVFSGPSLKSMPELVGHLIDGQPERCHEVRGVFSRERLAREENLHEVGPELDIDVDIPLDFDRFLADLERSFPSHEVEAVLPFETSRGCWWGERSHCTFCGLNGMTMKYRSMAHDKAIALMQGLFDRYGDKALRFQSVDNILPRTYLTEVLPYLNTPERVSIFYEVKADLKDREMAVLAQAGVTHIQPGIEAMATSSLRLMRKGTTSFQNLRFLKSCLHHGITPHWNLLIGFPGEEEEIYKKYFADLPLLVHLPPPSGVYPVRFDRYSPYFSDPEGYDLELRPADFYRMIYPFAEEDLEKMAYYFVDRNYNAPYLMRTARWMSKLRQRIDHWHTRYHQRDRGQLPKLEFQGLGEERRVLDTRAGVEINHDLSPVDVQILEALADPMKASRLEGRFDQMTSETLAQRLATLKGRGLLFQENELFMSLVVDPQACADAVLSQRPAELGELPSAPPA